MATQEELERRVAELERKIAEMQSAEPNKLFGLMDQLFPPETRSHLRTARKEQLLAFRSVLDKWIARMEVEEKPTPHREAIRVE